MVGPRRARRRFPGADRLLSPLAVILALAAGPAGAATALQDTLLSKLTGDWKVTGVTRGQPGSTAIRAEWVFGGQFLKLRIEDPAGKAPYTADVYIGQDETGVLSTHWLDATGGKTAKTLGTGRIEGQAVLLSFPYPDGEFRDRLEYDPAADRWRLLIVTGPSGKPGVFADWRLERAK